MVAKRRRLATAKARGGGAITIPPARFLPNRGERVFHISLFAPDFRRFPLSLHIVGVHTAWVLDLDDHLPAALILHQEVRHISSLVLLPVNPGNRDAMPLHPLDNMRIAFQAVHHPPINCSVRFCC